ncbi:hypothetical protein lbkm_1869 [Lachnospiraceae bacterium KM106-2]|nr:hypothetical protein lbkm_1869 [Lachnospiraceae bacterium KM106-2]
MLCKIEEITKPDILSMGAPKEIIVDKTPWEENGMSGYLYSYHMSTERFEREIKICYVISVDDVIVGKISYYDFVDFNYKDLLSKRAIDEIAKKENVTKEEVMACLIEKLDPLKQEIQEDFKHSEEYITDMQNEDILEKHKRERKKFVMELGLDGTKYDRCYNVFGQLMDGVYLEKLKDIMREREAFSRNSKKKHKDAWRTYSESSSTRSTGYYEEEDKEVLSKFYKALAKKYHPDSNPDLDTSKEMQLLNRLKKEWGI